jgi:hypothetical protein
VNIAPGRRGRITVTFTPTGPNGTVVSGTLFVDNFSFFAFTGDEVVAIPYRYRIG